MQNLLVRVLMITCGLLFIISSQSFAQENIKEEIGEKIKKVEGAVSKISIEHEGGTIEFTGEESALLYKRLKSSSRHLEIITEGERSFNTIGVERYIKEEFDSDSDATKIKIEIEDGEKKVTVTTIKDGKEEVKVLEGEEAEEYLEEYEEGAFRRFIIKKELDGDLEKVDFDDEIILFKVGEEKIIKSRKDDLKKLLEKKKKSD